MKPVSFSNGRRSNPCPPTEYAAAKVIISSDVLVASATCLSVKCRAIKRIADAQRRPQQTRLLSHPWCRAGNLATSPPQAHSLHCVHRSRPHTSSTPVRINHHISAASAASRAPITNRPALFIEAESLAPSGPKSGVMIMRACHPIYIVAMC